MVLEMPRSSLSNNPSSHFPILRRKVIMQHYIQYTCRSKDRYSTYKRNCWVLDLRPAMNSDQSRQVNYRRNYCLINLLSRHFKGCIGCHRENSRLYIQGFIRDLLVQTLYFKFRNLLGRGWYTRLNFLHNLCSLIVDSLPSCKIPFYIDMIQVSTKFQHLHQFKTITTYYHRLCMKNSQ